MNFDALQKYFQNDRFAERNNVELISAAPGQARARMVLQPHHLNALQIVQGGAIFTLADFTFAVACNSHGTVAVALNASVTFMKAARTGTLWAEAKEVARNAKVGTYLVDVKDEQGELIAQFQGLAYRKKEALA